jgi:tetratricopeptide (TPR) repeat protein
MEASELSQHLVEQPDRQARARLLARHASELDDDLAQALKGRADHFLRTDVEMAKRSADALLELAEHTGNPRHRALGLLAWANIYAIALGEYARALTQYDEATAIYQELGDDILAARSQIGRIWALTNLSRYDEAEQAAAWAADILEGAGETQLLALLTLNRAINFGRQGDDVRALATFNRARELLASLGESGEGYLPWIDQNRSIVLRNLGRLQESLEAAERAWRGMEAHGEFVEAARSRQSMAVTYLLLGRYTEALNLMAEARRIFLDDGRERDALLLDLFLCDCLLPMRRFQDVLEITGHVRPFFARRGMAQEIGKALLDEAVAYAGLGRFDEARASLAEARRRFLLDANPVLVASADLELAALLLHLGEWEESANLLTHAE